MRREEGRRRLRRLTRLGALLGVVLAGWLVTRSPLLDVDRIEVRGTEHATADAVREASGIRLGDAMTDVDRGRAAQRIDAVPWVATAQVARRWPNGITVTVTERAAVAAAATETGSWLLLDRDGRVLEEASGPGEVVAIEGLRLNDLAGVSLVPGDELTGAGLFTVEVAAVLPDGLRAATSSVVMGEGGDVLLRLGAGGEVRLGPPVELEPKLLAAVTVLEQLEEGCVAVLDVHVPATPVLTRARQCA